MIRKHREAEYCEGEKNLDVAADGRAAMSFGEV